MERGDFEVGFFFWRVAQLSALSPFFNTDLTAVFENEV